MIVVFNIVAVADVVVRIHSQIFIPPLFIFSIFQRVFHIYGNGRVKINNENYDD